MKQVYSCAALVRSVGHSVRLHNGVTEAESKEEAVGRFTEEMFETIGSGESVADVLAMPVEGTESIDKNEDSFNKWFLELQQILRLLKMLGFMDYGGLQRAEDWWDFYVDGLDPAQAIYEDVRAGM